MRVKEEVTMFARHWSVVASLEVVDVPGRVLYVAPANVMSGVLLGGGVGPGAGGAGGSGTAVHSGGCGSQSTQLHALAGEQLDAWWQA